MRKKDVERMFEMFTNLFTKLTVVLNTNMQTLEILTEQVEKLEKKINKPHDLVLFNKG